MNNPPRELESLLRAAIEAGYTNGQNNPNGYLSSADRDACVATLLSEHGEPIPKEGFHNCTVTNDPNVGFLVTDEPAPALDVLEAFEAFARQECNIPASSALDWESEWTKISLRAWLARPTQTKQQPVAYADPMALIKFADCRKQGTISGPLTHEWMWANPDSGLIPMYVAVDAPTEHQLGQEEHTAEHVQWWADAYEKEGGHAVVVGMLRAYLAVLQPNADQR